MIRAAALCLFAAPAIAGETALCGASIATLRPGDGEAVAEVAFVNRYAPSPVQCQDDMRLHGLTVTVQVANEPGRVPDTIRVFVPEGYVAVPQELTLGEDETGTIRIFQIVGGLLS
jgi:hypothetical protein